MRLLGVTGDIEMEGVLASLGVLRARDRRLVDGDDLLVHFGAESFAEFLRGTARMAGGFIDVEFVLKRLDQVLDFAIEVLFIKSLLVVLGLYTSLAY